jgi:hypothetical protein
MMKTLKEKNGSVLLHFGKKCWDAQRTLSAADYEKWKRSQRQLWHEAHPGQLVVDLDTRYIRLAKMAILWEFEHCLPNTGIGTMRELSKLGEVKLRYLFENGLVNPRTTRLQIDGFKSMQYPGGRSVAPRHRPHVSYFDDLEP